MKRIKNRILTQLLILSMFTGLMVISSCDAVYDLPEEPTLEASMESLLFGREGGNTNIKISANREWTAKLLNNQLADTSEWCSVSTTIGKAGDHTITISVENLEGDYREATLLLNCSGAGVVIPVMQSGIPIVTVMDATKINESEATLSGNWIYSGEIEVSEIGFAIAIESAGDFANTKLELDSIQQGTFSISFNNLLNETNYLFKFYVKTSSNEYYYSEAKSFKTDKAPVPLAVKDLVARGKELSVGGSKEQTESEFIEASVSNVVETDKLITLSLVDINCTNDLGEGKTVANYGITATIPSDSALIGTYKIGDVLNIRTKGGLLSNINGDPLFAIKDPNTISTTSTGYVLAPVSVSHIDLNDYLAMYVAIENTQITKSYLDLNTYPTWSNTLFTMEVIGSMESYLMQVPSGASFSSDPVLSGSGIIKGIVAPGQIGYLLNPRNSSDLSGLINDRFVSLLELRFFDPVFNGELILNEVSSSYISIPYSNGDGNVLSADISVTIGGVGAEGLSVENLTNPTLAVGIGELILQINGTPVVEGNVSFTIVGFDSYITTTTVDTTVIKPDIPIIGNFEVIWDVSTCNYATSMTYTANSNPSITITELVGVNFNGSPETTKYKEDFATTGCDVNTEANRISGPGVYLTTSLTVAAGKILQLSGLDITCRTNGGDSEVSFQYSLDGINFIEIDYFLIGSIEPTTINLGNVEALKNVVEGSTLTFRIVPVNPISTAKWGVSGKSTSRGLAIYGEVIDK